MFAIHVEPLHQESLCANYEAIELQLYALIQEYVDIFAEPKTLTPHRVHDH